jgi:hypothetical protein
VIYTNQDQRPQNVIREISSKDPDINKSFGGKYVPLSFYIHYVVEHKTLLSRAFLKFSPMSNIVPSTNQVLFSDMYGLYQNIQQRKRPPATRFTSLKQRIKQPLAPMKDFIPLISRKGQEATTDI